MTTTANNPKKCQHTKRNGQPCTAYALTGSAFCFAHDPARAAERAAARRAGGLARHGRTIRSVGTVEPVTIETPADVLRVLADEINNVLCLEISLSRGQTISRLCLATLKAFETAELEARIAALEQQRGIYDNP